MFFGNSNKKDIEISDLNKKIAVLEAQLESKNDEIKSVESRLQDQFNLKIQEAKKDCDVMKKIAAFSTEEAIMAIKNGDIIFKNDKANEHIDDFATLKTAVSRMDTRVVLSDCEAKISYKKEDDIMLVSLVKTTLNDTGDEDSLLHIHNTNINKSLTDTQNVYTELLDELKEMAGEAQSTATGSDEGYL